MSKKRKKKGNNLSAKERARRNIAASIEDQLANIEEEDQQTVKSEKSLLKDEQELIRLTEGVAVTLNGQALASNEQLQSQRDSEAKVAANEGSVSGSTTVEASNGEDTSGKMYPSLREFDDITSRIGDLFTKYNDDLNKIAEGKMPIELRGKER